MGSIIKKVIISMKLHFLILLFYSSLCFAQDSLNIQYSIIQIEFFEDHNIIKIKVPGWLKTSELMEQLQYLVIWPNEPPPTKIIYIYVFKETDQIGDTSETGCIYIPQKGFICHICLIEICLRYQFVRGVHT